MNSETRRLLSLRWCFEMLQFSTVSPSLTFLLKHGGDLLKSFALSLWDTEINKDCEAKKQHSKQEEDVTIQPSLVRSKNTVRLSAGEKTPNDLIQYIHVQLLCTHLYVRKGHAYDEVTGPVAAASKSDSCRPRPLAEQFGYYEPWDRTGTDLKETHKEEDGCQADVAHPWEVILKG